MTEKILQFERSIFCSIVRFKNYLMQVMHSNPTFVINILFFMKRFFSFVLLPLSIFFFDSCKKVINVDVNNSTPRVIIEAEITDESGKFQHEFYFSLSNPLSASNQRSPIVGAQVVLEDLSLHQKDTLIEVKPGVYITQHTLGVSGHSYQMNALINGVQYSAASTMPYAVPVDSMKLQVFQFFGQKVKQVVPVFHDPIGIANFYRFSLVLNDSVLNESTQAWEDAITDGKTNSRPINIAEQDLFKGNDTLVITMNCTDKASYDYYNTLQNATGDGQTPANPTSNISSNALGYFSAVTKKKFTVIVP